MKGKKDKKTSIVLIIILLIITIIISLIVYIIKTKREYKNLLENRYNLAFYELVNSIQNAEVYLAKAQISMSAKSGADCLTNVWREASIAQSTIAQLPLTNSEIGNTAKFLNQLSDYSYSLSRKNMNGERLSEEDMANIKQLYAYTVDLENTVNQLATDFRENRIHWKELQDTDTVKYASSVSSITAQNFQNLDANLHEYSGLIYDGAFSEHLNNVEKKGLTGDEIDADRAKQIAINFFEDDKEYQVEDVFYSEESDIPAYDIIVNNKEKRVNITISKKGGHIISANCDKNVETEIISAEEAINIGKEFLRNHGYENMKETYFLKENGIITINYAYIQRNIEGREVTIYPDLIKLKIALDDGSILGLEATGYLNTHTQRDFPETSISEDEARNVLNPELEILSTGLSIIPTKWKTEIYCYEFKGKIDGNDFLVYINAQSGKEEDVLLIVNTPNGTLTH